MVEQRSIDSLKEVEWICLSHNIILLTVQGSDR